MSFDYLNEAFKKLELLKEETFDTSPNGLASMKSFMDADLEDDSVRVIDPEADRDEDLQDSYIGKVITNCNVCHSNIFENKEDIVIDEDGTVNAEKQCPYCGETMGFTVMGEVTEFVAPTDEDTDPKVTVDGEQVPVEVNDVAEPLEESFADGAPTTEEEETQEATFTDKDIDSSKWKDAEDEWGSDTATFDVDKSKWESVEGRKSLKPHTLKILKMLDEEPLTEAVNNVSVETDDSVVHIESEEGGKVTVSTEPKDPETTGEEAIGPVSDETLADIEAANIPEEEPVEDAESVAEEESIEDEYEDVDFEEVDEDSFDELGESYLKRVYENVESFRTCDVSSDDNKLIVEGIIKFKSGAKKKTGFIFEAHSAANGKVRFTGMNEHFSRGSKSFALTGKVENKKLISESLTYNYRAKVGNGKSTRIYGTISK